MTQPSTGPQNGKPRRSMRVLLIGSLALNLLIVGIVAGAVISHRGEGPPGPVAERFGAPHIKALSYEDKRAVGRGIRTAYRKANVDHRADHKSYQQALMLLRSDPLDEAALTDLVIRLDRAGEARRQLARDVFLAQILAMSPDERKAYADRLEDVLERGPKGKKDHDKKRPSKQP